MEITEQSVSINIDTLLSFEKLSSIFSSKTEKPVRFVPVKQNRNTFECEISILHKNENDAEIEDIFLFQKRKSKSDESFNVVAVIPTGIGASVGGHSGDGQSAMRLLSSACDTLITHPNSMNGADIIELMPNMLYVEGSTLSRLLMGTVGLQRRRNNRILLIVDKQNRSIMNMSINSASAARMALGMDIDVLEMDCGYARIGTSESGRAIGNVSGLEKLLEIGKLDYDAFALSTLADYDDETLVDYFTDKLHVNPWGGIEAILTHALSLYINKPIAHSPMNKENSLSYSIFGIVNPLKASEVISITYLHCILKGLHKSPAIVKPDDGLSAKDVDVLVIPDRCIGLPVLAALKQGIKVIFVSDNENIMKNNVESLPWARGQIYHAKNYLEAIGILNSIRIGMNPNILKRPSDPTNIIKI